MAPRPSGLDGRDIEPGAESRTDYGMKCRLYRSGAGASGEVPEALTHARGLA